MTYVVDTHALLWYVGDSPRLGAQADAILSDRTSNLVLPAIVLAEAYWMLEHGRLPLTISALQQALATETQVTFFPLDERVIARCFGLKSIPEMHDRQIVATALLLAENGEEVRIINRDRNIEESQLIPTVWD